MAFLLSTARHLHASNVLFFWMPGMEEHRTTVCGFSWVGNIRCSSSWLNLKHNIQDTLLQTMWRYIFRAYSLSHWSPAFLTVGSYLAEPKKKKKRSRCSVSLLCSSPISITQPIPRQGASAQYRTPYCSFSLAQTEFCRHIHTHIRGVRVKENFKNYIV